MTAPTRRSAGTYSIPKDEFQELVAFTRTDTFAARRDRTSEFFRADKTQEVTLKILAAGGGLTVACTLGGGIIGG